MSQHPFTAEPVPAWEPEEDDLLVFKQIQAMRAQPIQLRDAQLELFQRARARRATRVGHPLQLENTPAEG